MADVNRNEEASFLFRTVLVAVWSTLLGAFFFTFLGIYSCLAIGLLTFVCCSWWAQERFNAMAELLVGNTGQGAYVAKAIFCPVLLPVFLLSWYIFIVSVIVALGVLIPPITFSDIEVDPRLFAVSPHDNHSLIMAFGPKGTGKTTATRALAHARKSAIMLTKRFPTANCDIACTAMNHFLCPTDWLAELPYTFMFTQILKVARDLRHGVKPTIILDIPGRTKLDYSTAKAVRDQLKALAEDENLADVVVTGSDGLYFTLLSPDARWRIYASSEVNVTDARKLVGTYTDINLTLTPRIFPVLREIKRFGPSAALKHQRDIESRVREFVRLCPQEHKRELLTKMITGFGRDELPLLCDGKFAKLAGSEKMLPIQEDFHQFVQNSVFSLPDHDGYKLQFEVSRHYVQELLSNLRPL